MTNVILGSIPWSKEEIEMLKDLVNKKHTSSQIAKVLGRTRNSVMGAAFRMGLSLNKREAPVRKTVNVVELRPKAVPKPAPVFPKRVEPVVVKLPFPTVEREAVRVDAEPVDERKGIRLTNRERNQCAYILGPTAAEKTRCCGELVYKNSSWCPAHYEVVLVPLRKKGEGNKRRFPDGRRTWLFGRTAQRSGR